VVQILRQIQGERDAPRGLTLPSVDERWIVLSSARNDASFSLTHSVSRSANEMRWVSDRSGGGDRTFSREWRREQAVSAEQVGKEGSEGRARSARSRTPLPGGNKALGHVVE